jgi:hypothetical protein
MGTHTPDDGPGHDVDSVRARQGEDQESGGNFSVLTASLVLAGCAFVLLFVYFYA